jgi:hypothetical protein
VAPGDYNLDGLVDASDYLVWRNTVGSMSNLAADGNGDGKVDQDDYVVWRGNFGRSSPAAAQSAARGGSLGTVPEPSTLMFCVFAGLGLLSHRRRVS